MQKLVKLILPYLFIFIASLYRPIDPDLGWHLKYGEYFFENFRPLYENTFSTEMPDFLWPNISWGTDVVSYALYNLGGFWGLTLGGALVVTLTFFFFSKAFRLDYWEKALIFPLLLYFLQPINSNSFRGQLISLALLGVLFYLTNRYEEKGAKTLFWVPFLFLVWANLHGLFLLGLGIFVLWQGLFLVSEFLQTKKVKDLTSHIKLFIPVSILSFLATLIHPFGMGIYLDAFAHLNDPLLKGIVEYLPVEDLSLPWFNLFLTALLAGTTITAFTIGKRLKQNLAEVGIFTTLYLLSLWVKRYAWAMYYTLIPLLKPIASFVKPDSKKGIFVGASLLFAIYIIIVLFLKYPFTQFTLMSWENYCQISTNCSARGAETLRKYYREGKTMTLYNWGGWLIWNFPDLKPSVDGRMHLWRDETGYSAFEHDYYLEQNITDIGSSKYDVVLTRKDKPIYSRLQELASQNLWEMVYEDEISVIFIRQ